ncbi:MAG: glycosyltransferase family 8 protein [Acidimicrobiales bacterium]|nr:glycosyltransferase family 8 protein [Hyphomonadaceae bacterium]RZV41053.1 MAG: glycosyltransferase family 8 protein [Acidimicrobiales bacterium]
MKIAITTATDRGYLPAAACQLKSVADHLPSPDAAELFLVCCDVSGQDVKDAEDFFKSHNINVSVIVPDFVDERVKTINDKWPRAAYLRLYFDAIFGKEYKRLIYFDADTRVRSSLAPLLECDLRGNPVGAVHDFIYYVTGNIRRRRNDLHLSDDAPYLQSGVMVFDWPETLQNDYLGKARQVLLDNPQGCQEAPDQDALNVAFENLWTPLDPRWNLHETYLGFGGHLKPNLEHYTSTKPWSIKRPEAWRNAAEWYSAQLKSSAWPDFIPAQSPKDKMMSKVRFAKFRYTPKIRNGLARGAPFVLDMLKTPRQRSDAEELPWAPRNRKDVEDMAAALIEEAEGKRDLIRPPESVLDGFSEGRLIGIN